MVRAAAKPHWLPGTERRTYLDAADLPGNFSFDPLNLAENPAALTWFQQAELQNGRWAMLGVAGILTPELGAKLGGITGTAGKVAWCVLSCRGRDRMLMRAWRVTMGNRAALLAVNANPEP